MMVSVYRIVGIVCGRERSYFSWVIGGSRSNFLFFFGGGGGRTIQWLEHQTGLWNDHRFDSY